jgi:hypothetical protein
MEPEANRLIGIQHMHFENDIRQENLQLKIRIRELEATISRIRALIQEPVYLRPRIDRWQ